MTVPTVPSAVRVPSTSGSGTWVVRRHADGELSCECPRFDHSGHPKACRHTDIVARADVILQKCAEVHGADPEGRLCRDCLVAVLAIAVRRQREVSDAQFKAGKARGKQIVENRRRRK